MGDFNQLLESVKTRLAAHPAVPLAGPLPGEELAAELAAVLAQARAVAAALDAALVDGGVEDRNHYEYVAQNLARIAAFESFSLAEYTYHLAGGRNPGVRLWLEEERWQRRVKVLLFPEVGRWQADAAGHKISRHCLTLELGHGEPRPVPPEGWEQVYDPAEGWRRALTRAFCLAATLKL